MSMIPTNLAADAMMFVLDVTRLYCNVHEQYDITTNCLLYNYKTHIYVQHPGVFHPACGDHTSYNLIISYLTVCPVDDLRRRVAGTTLAGISCVARQHRGWLPYLQHTPLPTLPTHLIPCAFAATPGCILPLSVDTIPQLFPLRQREEVGDPRRQGWHMP